MRFRLHQYLLLWVAGLFGFLVIVFLVARLLPPSSQKEEKVFSVSSLDQRVEKFFEEYWQRPIAPQGIPPPTYTEKEASLRPEACGSCHTRQYADWKESLHSKAMGAGPWGQIIDLTQGSPGEATLCRSCHAPLSEQSPVLAKTTGRNEANYEKNPHFDSELQLQGITCAACHVRQHQRFGPPRNEQTFAKYPPGTPNHGGVERTPYFEKAEFCKDCHQFDLENAFLLKGKLLQDTYREWKNSIWGKGEAGCQECHMPQRRHLWKGIHDAEWVKGAIRVEAQVRKAPSQPGGTVELGVEVTNASVGHKFPTYITPKVFVRAALLDGRGKILPGTEQEKIIGWDARFEGGKWKEYLDTRIPPGEKSEETFRWTLPNQAKKIRTWVEVHPDHFYHVHFYPEYLKSQELTPEGRKLMEKALQESGRTSYILFERLISLN